MKRFNEYLIEAVNVHMEHLEDLIFNKGLVGARETFSFLSSLLGMLSGNSKSKISTTSKWDGAPAMVIGIDPADGKFFVAKKSVFNVSPKFYKTQADIDKDLSGELADKFSIALREFKKLGIKSGIYQGDLMFTKKDLKKEKIDGEVYLTFHPNTIIYAVPYESELADKIRKAEIGVIWHTTYTGSSITQLKASFGKDIVSKFSQPSSVWMDDATYKDVSGSATMTMEETKEVRNILSKAGSILHDIPSDVFKAFTNEEVLIRIKTYNNVKIRSGEAVKDVSAHVKGLIDYVEEYYAKEEETKKTPKGKEAVQARKKAVLSPIVNNLASLKEVYKFHGLITSAKNIIIAKMNEASSIGTFLRTSNGYKVTSPEGYVAIDRLSSNAIKLVDRLEFSKANFSDDVSKGWQ